MDTTALLEVDSLAVEYRKTGLRASVNRVIDDVSFHIGTGETLALVGESGSGKSTIGKVILGLTPAAAGSIRFRGRQIDSLSARARRPLASELQVIFQNPYGSLNPSLKIGRILAEPLLAAGRSRREAMGQIADLLSVVNMPADTVDRYPGDFSGGQRQRIAIARALALKPSLVVCDEPTSALDVSTQAAVLELLAELQQRLGVSYLFITHDLAVVRQFADRTIVLQNGRIVEEGSSSDVCERPQHPYTQRLVAAAPVPDPRLQRERRERRNALAAAG
ncbi:ATP-binding cassette domain-containing protein [Leifsonia sp. Root112D2]|uniref:ATP-binding cassette domain-containing protein n=1 Tax=Leifsonia sp. Root112D2 TaxID=1736426 RepID=UPI0006FADB69|nr:ATP-binding cassette domain-containing protein [Leifsonia sp. Root112D2]KQV07253.1 peptide ABC transporter ATP-binding protein [Leifsonia sp. Root112D2]